MSALPDTDSWLGLLAAASRGGQGWIRALRAAGGAGALLHMDAPALSRAGLDATGIGLLRSESARPPDGWRDWLEADGHALVVYGSARYPERLREIPDAPLALWADGRAIDLLADPALAVVGSRHPSRSGRDIAESLAHALGALGITIVSGLALGIDAASHRGALRRGGSTLAVLGSGIDRIYPAVNAGLADDIRTSGLIVSEYGPGHGTRAWQFPQRNRIIAGLCLGTLVVEAAQRSGSLITARLAADYGREVFAVPGSIHSALSRGCHKLIREGAKLVETVDDILAEIAPQLASPTDAKSFAAGASEPAELPDVLRDCLDFSPVGFDTLVAATGLTAGELSSMLLHLELQGKIEALAGGRYCLLAKRA